MRIVLCVGVWCVMCGVVWCVMWCGVVGSVWCIMCDVSCYILHIAVSGVENLSNKVKQGKEVRGRNEEERENGWS